MHELIITNLFVHLWHSLAFNSAQKQETSRPDDSPGARGCPSMKIVD
ncbi:MAG: hypothetical protein LBS69_06950 [Prevotellaceae bacterium]|nr:hypothetical protein [Prevotellaceae bacterium]